MDKNHNYGLITLAVIAALLVGSVFTYAAFPREVTTEVIKNVPGPTVYKNVTVEVPLDAKATYLDKAVDDFLSDKLEDLTDCGGSTYDEDQIEVSKVYDAWNVQFDKERVKVSFRVKLKYLDSDVEEKCYITKDVSVLYKEGHDPRITID